MNEYSPEHQLAKSLIENRQRLNEGIGDWFRRAFRAAGVQPPPGPVALPGNVPPKRIATPNQTRFLDWASVSNHPSAHAIRDELHRTPFSSDHTRPLFRGIKTPTRPGFEEYVDRDDDSEGFATFMHHMTNLIGEFMRFNKKMKWHTLEVINLLNYVQHYGFDPPTEQFQGKIKIARDGGWGKGDEYHSFDQFGHEPKVRRDEGKIAKAAAIAGLGLGALTGHVVASKIDQNNIRKDAAKKDTFGLGPARARTHNCDVTNTCPEPEDKPKLKEARVSQYYTVFYFNPHNNKWCQEFDADDMDDARDAAANCKREGLKTIIIRVPKDQADWRKVDPHQFVTNHLKGKGAKKFSPGSRAVFARVFGHHNTKPVDPIKDMDNPVHYSPRETHPDDISEWEPHATWKLVDQKTLKPIPIGHTFPPDGKGDAMTLVGLAPPHRPGTSGKVHVRVVNKTQGRDYEATYYANVVGCKFIKLR